MELNGKQKSYLRGKAQTLKPMFQIGKDGLTEEVKSAIMNYIIKNELGKIAILDTCPEPKEEIALKLEEIKLQTVQIIGNNIIVFKRNHKLEEGIRFPR
jgi:RNA-binding protein